VERIRMQETVKFRIVDLTRINGKGQFRCPNCGVRITPDDKTEKAYTICEPIMRECSLEKIILRCNKCGTQIHLTGFMYLDRIRC
jgi:DNA-directed RNA polymerase subunit RPC12/RpoP